MAPSTIKASTAAARREAVDSRVYAAVEELLGEGERYSELSVATIADRAGVARSTFYVHFADKTELLVRLAAETTADMFAAAYEWTDRTVQAQRPGAHRAALEATCEQIVADYRAHVQVLSAIQAATGYDPTVADYWFERIEAFAAHAATRLRAAQEAGNVPEEVDVTELASMAAWSIERTVSQRVARRGPRHDKALAATLARGLWLMTFGVSQEPPA